MKRKIRHRVVPKRKVYSNEIAKRLGRHRRTIEREITRGTNIFTK